MALRGGQPSRPCTTLSQTSLSCGLPEDQSARHELYNLVFHGARVKSPAPTSQVEQGAPGEASGDPVDRSGFGFGPAGGPKATQSPYAKGAPQTLAPGDSTAGKGFSVASDGAAAPREPGY